MESAPRVMAKFDLTLSLREAGKHIVGGLEYATALFERRTMERYLGYFRSLLKGMVADDAQEVDGLVLLPKEERQRVLYEWNETKMEYPNNKCIHKLFEEQIKKTPKKPKKKKAAGKLTKKTKTRPKVRKGKRRKARVRLKNPRKKSSSSVR